MSVKHKVICLVGVCMLALHCSRFHQFNNDNKLYFLSTHPSLPPRATLLLCLAGTLLLQQPARVCVTCSLCNSRALIPHKLCTRRLVGCSAHFSAFPHFSQPKLIQPNLFAFGPFSFLICWDFLNFIAVCEIS